MNNNTHPISFTVCVNRPGCLPESDPQTYDLDPEGPLRTHIETIFDVVKDEVESHCDIDMGGSTVLAYARLVSRIQTEMAQYGQDVIDSGMCYMMPDGYVIDVTVNTEGN